MTQNVVTQVDVSPALVVDLVVLGLPVRVRCRRPETRDLLARDWSRCLAAVPAEEPLEVTVDDADGAVAPRDLYGLTSEITRLAIEARAGSLLLLHACGIATGTGEVVALVGASGAGKSTAARVLCREDFGYVTDETLAVDERGAVLAYPKPLSLHDPATGVTKAQHGPDDLGLRPAPGELTLGRVVLLDRRQHEVEPSLEPVPLVDAVIDVIPQTSALPSMTDPLQRLCGHLTAAGGAERLTFTQIEDARELLADAPTRDRRAEEWSALTEPGQERDDLAWAIRDGRVHPTPFVDAVRVGDEAVVLVGRTPMRLSGIGLTIWAESHRGPSLEELTETVVAVHGPHPEAAGLVADAVETLRASGAVTCRRPRTVAALLAAKPRPRPAPDTGRDACRGV